MVQCTSVRQALWCMLPVCAKLLSGNFYVGVFNEAYRIYIMLLASKKFLLVAH